MSENLHPYINIICTYKYSSELHENGHIYRVVKDPVLLSYNI
jgi:hypothetical protein